MDYSNVVLLSDLDGTLFNSKGKISASDKAAIAEFCSKGGKFGIATGRAPYNALQYLDGVAINAPCIVFNGAATYSYAGRAYCGTTRFVDKAAITGLIEECLRVRPNVNIQIYTPDEIIYVSLPETADPDFLSIHQPCRFLSFDAALRLSWIKSLLFGTPGDTEWLTERVVESGIDKRIATANSSTDIVPNAKYLELLPLNINKGAAVDQMRQSSFALGKTFVAAGDYWNDVELLTHADYSVVPGNAPEGVRALASRVGPTNNESLMTYIIKNVITEL